MAQETKSYIVTRNEVGGLESLPPISANGKRVSIELDTPIDLTEAAASAIKDCDVLTIIPAEEGDTDTDSPPKDENSDGAGGGSASPSAGGPGEGGADTFDASIVIDGNIAEVTARLEGLDADQLAAVAEAEEAGENRAGALSAINAAIAAATTE